MVVLVHGCGAEDLLSTLEIERTVEQALRYGGRSGAHLEVVVVDDATLAELHQRFLGDPSLTDVMAFDLGSAGGGPEGEIFVSAERARAVAAVRAGDARRELALYLVHGALHLCGFDDHEPAARQRMRAAEACVLEELGYGRDSSAHEID